jgi:hypothetical protein
MRETMNVPFSFAMLESGRHGPSPRVARAAVVLSDAAKGLTVWKNPPGNSDSARAMFFAFAKNLETQTAQWQSEPSDPHSHLQAIRATCNGCHHYFRTTIGRTTDVGYDVGDLR